MLWNLLFVCLLLLVGQVSSSDPECSVEYDSSTYVMNFTFDARNLGYIGSRGGVLVCPKCSCDIPKALVVKYDNTIKNLEKRIEILEAGGVSIGSWQYWFSTDKMSWKNGQEKCKNMGMRLASAGVRDKDTRKEIENAIRARGYGFFWIGLNDIVSEGNWVWSDYVVSTTSETISWRAGEPNNHHNEDCAGLETGIVDLGCHRHFRIICERDS